MSTARTLTTDYEHWLGDHIPLDRVELTGKHRELRMDRFRFLRGTYYLWLVFRQRVTPLAERTRSDFNSYG